VAVGEHDISELTTKVAVIEARLAERKDASRSALELATKALESRLEGMNEFRDQLRTQAATFIRREEHDVLRDAISEVAGRVSSVETKLYLGGAGITIIEGTRAKREGLNASVVERQSSGHPVSRTWRTSRAFLGRTLTVAYDSDGGRISFRPEISLGQALNALLILITLLSGGIIWATSKSSGAEQTRAELNSFKADIQSQLTEVKTSLTSGLNGIQAQISGLPDQRAELTQLKGNYVSHDGRLTSLEGRLQSLERLEDQDSARIDQDRGAIESIYKASNLNIPLPPRPEPRHR